MSVAIAPWTASTTLKRRNRYSTTLMAAPSTATANEVTIPMFLSLGLRGLACGL